MTLNKVQQTKIRAALAWVRDKHGPEDVQHLIAMVRQMRDQGAPERAAWNHALDQLQNADPELSDKIAQSFNLLDASDAATITRYEEALTKYVDHGDQSGLLDMRPEIARDDAALDFRNGAISKEQLDARLAEIDAGNIVPGEQQPSAEQPQAQAPQSFGFGKGPSGPQVGAASTISVTNGSQVSLGSGPTGYVARGALNHLARETLQPGTEGYPADAA